MARRPHFLILMFLAASLTNCNCDDVVVVQVAAWVAEVVGLVRYLTIVCNGVLL